MKNDPPIKIDPPLQKPSREKDRSLKIVLPLKKVKRNKSVWTRRWKKTKKKKK